MNDFARQLVDDVVALTGADPPELFDPDSYRGRRGSSIKNAIGNGGIFFLLSIYSSNI